jgi:adenine-specific DNA-methyltransferase
LGHKNQKVSCVSNRNAKAKLELTWIGKENRPKLEPRILLEDPQKSYHASHRVTDHDIFDNLFALKAIEAERGKRRRAVFDAQDEVDRRREQLINEIEGKLQQKVSSEQLFAIRWHLQ